MNVIEIVLTTLVLLFTVLLWVMIYDTNRFIMLDYCYTDSRIRKKCKAVVIADLHNKQFGFQNERLIKAIDEMNPDFIIVAGDIIVAMPNKDFQVAEHLLKCLSEKYPVYFGNGNHEHRIKLYPDTYGDMATKFEEIIEKYHIHHLVNDDILLEEYGIRIFGSEIERKYYKRFHAPDMESDYMKTILGNASADNYNVLIAHKPDYFPQYANWGADLVLSGHVHGGIIRIPFWGKGILSPNICFFPKYDGGIFKQDDSTMILSRGLGYHTLPFRLFNPGELISITFEPKGKSS